MLSRGLGEVLEESADELIGELVTDDPTVAPRADRARRPQKAKGLGHRRVVDVRGHREIGDADRPGLGDADEQRQPGSVTQEAEAGRPCTDLAGFAERADRVADALAVEYPAPGRDEMHPVMLPQMTR